MLFFMFFMSVFLYEQRSIFHIYEFDLLSKTKQKQADTYY